MCHDYPLVYLAAGRVSAAQGQTDAALENFGQAEQFAASMGMRPIIWKARCGAAEALEARASIAPASSAVYPPSRMAGIVIGPVTATLLGPAPTNDPATALETRLPKAGPPGPKLRERSLASPRSAMPPPATFIIIPMNTSTQRNRAARRTIWPNWWVPTLVTISRTFSY